jgi:acyl carrier protein
MTSRTQEQIMQDLGSLLRNFNGKEYSGDIGPGTFFFADLGLVSIDAVVFAETLERFYDRTFPFARFLSEIADRGTRDIEVGELAAFLQREMIGSSANS